MAEIKNVVKRNGQIVKFDQTKILNAITKANNSVPESDRMNENTIGDIVNRVVEKCSHSTENIGVEDIQDMVETEIMSVNAYEVAKHYITYRFQHSQIRQKNTTDDKILSLVGLNNKEAKCENSNKNPVINSTQRDYMAGEVSRDLTRRYLLPQIVLDAWNEGAIHFHDSDYYSQHMHNCFSGGTRFITDTGIREFRSFKDGEQVYVKDYLGVTRLATVHTYGHYNTVYAGNGKNFTMTSYPVGVLTERVSVPDAKAYYTELQAKPNRVGYKHTSPVWKVAVNEERRKEFNSEWSLCPDMIKSGYIEDHINYNYPKDDGSSDYANYPWSKRSFDFDINKMDMPIPATELMKNSALKQNPAYAGQEDKE